MCEDRRLVVLTDEQVAGMVEPGTVVMDRYEMVTVDGVEHIEPLSVRRTDTHIFTWHLPKEDSGEPVTVWVDGIQLPT